MDRINTTVVLIERMDHDKQTDTNKRADKINPTMMDDTSQDRDSDTSSQFDFSLLYVLKVVGLYQQVMAEYDGWLLAA